MPFKDAATRIEYNRKVRARNKLLYGVGRGRAGVGVENKKKLSKQRSRYYHRKEKGTQKFRSASLKWHLKKTYGLSMERFHEMLRSQAGECAICEKQTMMLNVDHDHTTGAVRGLLCNLCNSSLGRFELDGWKDRVERYLSIHKQEE